jgi:hypothetical protein
MKTLVRERTKENFDLVTGTLSPSEARKQLAIGNYGVVLDQDGAPVALVVAEDLEQAANKGMPSLLSSLAGLPATVIVGSEVEMQKLADSEALTLFDVGARGAVVLDDEGVVGILPVETIDEYLGSGEYKPAPETMGPSAKAADTGLGGSHQSPSGRVTCAADVVLGGDVKLDLGKPTCVKCGYTNEIFFLDENNLPACQNPDLPSHTLKLR